MKIFLASDHAGFALKEKIKKYLNKKNFQVEDCGAFAFDEKDDYPDFVISCAEKVSRTKNSFGIVFGGSGQGEAIAANKIKGIRAAVYYGKNLKIVKLSKEHNDANVLSLGARFLSEKDALRAIDLWLKTKFSDEERHKKRLGKIER
ncbi:RpiB/LacA/LacB family sugar-phosphate isomerase [Candidatus Pacearchaeota archaeon]|nr:RpiB/LacA/LacB family sugar-phosphate isomerase [Candidatus Pacearchaeota archaeon]